MNEVVDTAKRAGNWFAGMGLSAIIVLFGAGGGLIVLAKYVVDPLLDYTGWWDFYPDTTKSTWDDNANGDWVETRSICHDCGSGDWGVLAWPSAILFIVGGLLLWVWIADRIERRLNVIDGLVEEPRPAPQQPPRQRGTVVCTAPGSRSILSWGPSAITDRLPKDRSIAVFRSE